MDGRIELLSDKHVGGDCDFLGSGRWVHGGFEKVENTGKSGKLENVKKNENEKKRKKNVFRKMDFGKK